MELADLIQHFRLENGVSQRKNSKIETCYPDDLEKLFQGHTRIRKKGGKLTSLRQNGHISVNIRPIDL